MTTLPSNGCCAQSSASLSSALPSTRSSSKPILSVVTLVNDAEAYAISRGTLSVQHDASEIEWIPIEADRQGWNAAEGLNVGIEQSRADWVACAHQDVLYPKGWWRTARARIGELASDAAVVALVGVDCAGAFRGHVLDPNGHCRWGPLPSRVVALDEHVVLVRTSTRLRFDPGIPGFHCYGTDLALEALNRGLGVYAIDAPVIHLSTGRKDARFDAAADRLFEKWNKARRGVLSTPSVVLWDKSLRSLPLLLRAKLARRRSRRHRHGGAEQIGER